MNKDEGVVVEEFPEECPACGFYFLDILTARQLEYMRRQLEADSPIMCIKCEVLFHLDEKSHD